MCGGAVDGGRTAGPDAFDVSAPLPSTTNENSPCIGCPSALPACQLTRYSPGVRVPGIAARRALPLSAANGPSATAPFGPMSLSEQKASWGRAVNQRISAVGLVASRAPAAGALARKLTWARAMLGHNASASANRLRRGANDIGEEDDAQLCSRQPR